MEDKFKIIIQSQLDESGKQINALNAQIKNISNKLNKIDLKINIDSAQIKQVQDLAKRVSVNTGRVNIDSSAEAQIKLWKAQEAAIERTRKAEERQQKAAEKANMEREKALQYEQKLRLALEKSEQAEKKKTEQIEIQLNKLKERAKADLEIVNVYGKKDQIANAKQLNDEIQKTTSLTGQAGVAAKKYSDNLRELARQTKTTSVSTMSFKEMLQTAAKSFSVWMVVTHAFYASIRELKKGIDTIVSLDDSLLELNKVVELTNRELQEVTDRAYAAGKQLGRTGQDVIDATSLFAKASYTLEESFDLAQTALLLTNVADGITDVRDAASSIIAVLRGYSMEAEKASNVVDILNEVSNNFAVDTDNLADGLTRTAGTLSQTGTSLEELTAILTGGFESLRNMEKVSSGLITISQRLRGVAESGEEIDGLMPKLQDAFQKYVGIDIQPVNGELMSTFDILKNLQAAWGGMSEEARQHIGELASGVRQAPVLNALMTNWENVEKAVESATNSMGSAAAENEKYLASISGRLQNFESVVQRLWKNTIDSDLVKLIVDLGSTIVSLVDNLGLVNIALGAFFFYLERTHGLGNMVSTAIMNIITSMKGLTLQTIAATAATTAMTVATVAFQAAISFGLAAAITGLISWITKLITNFKTAKQQQAELAASIVENSKAIQESLSDTKLSSSLIDEYERLNKQLENNEIAADKVAETKERLQVIESKLLELYPDLVTQSDLENDSLQDKIPLLKEVFDIKNDQYKTELELERQRSLALIEGWEEEKAILEERKREYEEELSIQIEGRRQLEVLYKELLDALAVENYDAIPDIMDRTNKIARNIGEYFLDYMFFINFFENDFNKTTDEINTKLNDTRDSLTEVTNQIDTFYKNSMLLSDVYAEFSSSMESFNSIAEPTTEQIEKQVEALDNIKTKAKDSMDAKTYAAFATEVDKAVTSLNNLKNTMDEYGDSTANAEEQQKKLQEALDKASKSFKDVTSKIQSLYKVQHDLNSAGKVTAEITQEIIDKHPELLQYLGSREDLENAITGAITTQESVQSQALQNMLANDAQFYNEKLRGTVELYKEIFSAYGQDVNNFKTAAEAKDAIDVAIVNAIGSRWSTMYKGTAASLSSAISAMKKQRDALYALPGQDYFTIQTLKDLNTNIRALEGFLKVLTGFETAYKATIGKINLGGINLGGIKTPKSSSSSKSSESSTEKASDAIKKFLDTLANKTELIEFNLAMNQLDQSYYEATGNINKVNQLRVNEINLYKQLNKQINSNIKSVESKLKTVKKGSDDYETLQDTLFDLRQEYRQNEVTINSINDALKEHDRILRDRVIEAEQLVLKAVMAVAKAQYDANKKRLQDEYDTNKKIIQDKIDTLNKEKALIREEYNARRQQKQEEKKLEELQKLETRFNKISKDNSGMYEKEKLDLAKQIADLREEIYEDEVLKQIELREKEIDSQIDGYKKEQELLDANYKTAQEKMDEAYQKAQETYATYWKEVESIMKGSQSSIIKYLQGNLDEYKQAGKLQKEAYLEGWGELFGDVKDIQSGKTKDSATVKKEVGTSTGTNYAGTTSSGSSSSSSSSSSTKTSKPYPGTALKRGAKGSNVKEIQKILGVDVDGSFGPKTEAAVKAYQKKYGLKVDGSVGPETWAHMFGTSKSTSTSSKPKVSAISSTLKRGAKGSNVKTLQKALNEILGTNLAVDGSFGGATLAAVLQFQRKYGLSQDGSVGPKTKAKFKALGYDQGGLVDYTGLAMVHGSKKKPEAFLNHKETSIIGDLARAIREVPRNALSNLTRFGGGLTFAPIVNIDASGATKEDAIAIGRTVKTELAGLFDKAQRKSGLAVSVPR